MRCDPLHPDRWAEMKAALADAEEGGAPMQAGACRGKAGEGGEELN
jgi:hypothetical protein